jgi:hypothetical protein
MHYEINVSLNGAHLFATDARSATTEEVARRLFKCFCEKFPQREGYLVTCTYYETTGKPLRWRARDRQDSEVEG